MFDLVPKQVIKITDKYKIIDTNILLTDSSALYAFKPKADEITRVIIPVGVLAEIDFFKDEKYQFNNQLTDRARKAREVTNELDRILKANKGDFEEGITIAPNYILQSSYNIEQQMGLSLDDILSKTNTDRRLINICAKLKSDKYEDVELVTGDITLRNIARSVGIEASEWKDYTSKRKVNRIYRGWREVALEPQLFEEFTKKGSIPSDALNLKDLTPNEYLFCETNDFKGRYDAQAGKIVPLQFYMKRKSPVCAQNPQQEFLMDSLRNPNIDLVFAIGIAGCGKTFLAVDAGIEQCLEYSTKFKVKGSMGGKYRKLLLTRPIIPHKGEEDLGFRPGEFKQKVAPWIEPFMDQFESLFESYGITPEALEDYFRDDKIEVELLRTMRGRSYHNLLWIVDEAQNYNYDSYETLLTRPANGVKLVICGDPSPSQSDIKNVTYENSPLLYYNMLMHIDNSRIATIYFNEPKHCARRGIAAKYLENKTKYAGKL